MGQVLQRHEYEYLQTFNAFIRNKENDLRGLIVTMNERAADHAGREKKIRQLEQNLSRMRREAVEHGKIEEKL